MALKFTADPELGTCFYRILVMGSLGSVTASRLPLPCMIVLLGIAALAIFYRQILFLTLDEDEARMLGTPVTLLRLLILTAATLIVASIVSVTGLISFAGLLGAACRPSAHKRLSAFYPPALRHIRRRFAAYG